VRSISEAIQFLNITLPGLAASDIEISHLDLGTKFIGQIRGYCRKMLIQCQVYACEVRDRELIANAPTPKSPRDQLAKISVLLNSELQYFTNKQLLEFVTEKINILNDFLSHTKAEELWNHRHEYLVLAETFRTTGMEREED
jgi:hypothetical protein